MPQIQINGEMFDVFVVRGTESPPVPIELNVVPRSPVPTVRVPASVASVQLVSSNTSRKGISIYNFSTAALFLSYATPATQNNFFMAMEPGAFLMLDQQLLVTSPIYGIWSAANGSAQVTQYV